MKIKGQKEVLLELLEVSKIAPSGSKTQFAGLELKAKDKSVTATCTDQENTASRSSSEIEIEKEGKIQVPGKKLYEMVKKQKDDSTVQIIDKDKQNIQVKCGKFNAKLSKQEVHIPQKETKGDFKYTINGDTFLNMYRIVSYAVGKDQHRPIFTGILFEFTKNRLNVVATDTRQLAMTGKSLEDEHEDRQMVVPKTTIDKFVSFIEENVEIISDGTQVTFISGDTVLITPLIKGEYPNYKAAIPQEFNTDITVDREEFLDALDRVSTMKQSREPKIQVEIDGNKVSVQSLDETGAAQDTVDAEKNGEDIKVLFQPDYLINTIKAIRGEKVLIKVDKSNTPVILTGSDKVSVHLLVPAQPNVQEQDNDDSEDNNQGEDTDAA